MEKLIEKDEVLPDGSIVLCINTDEEGVYEAVAGVLGRRYAGEPLGKVELAIEAEKE